MNRVYCYVRFSSNKQSDGDSIDRQQRLIDEYLTRHNAVIAERFEDLGVSAFRGKNIKVGALSEFLKRVERGEIKKGDTLIVESLDRISRQKELDTIHTLLEILRKGVLIYTLSDRQIYDYHEKSHTNIAFKINYITSRAHEESDIKSQRSKSSWARKHAAAKNIKSLMTRKLPYWLYVDSNKVSIDEVKANEVRRAFELATYNLGTQSIASTLNREGAQKRWSLIAVRHLLSSKSVYGCLEINKTKHLNGELEQGNYYEEVEGYYPAVIDKSSYYAVQKLVEQKKESGSVRGRASKGFRNVFKGLIRCLYCETLMHQNFTWRIKNGKKYEYMYLVCGKSLVNACSSDADELKKIMIPYRFILEPFLLFYENFGAERLFDAEHKEHEKKQTLESLKQERIEKETMLANLTAEIERDPQASSRTVLKLIKKIEDDIDSIEEKAKQLMAEISVSSVNTLRKKEIDSSDIHRLLESEEGRLKFNTLLRDNKVVIYVQKQFEQEYSNMFIYFTEHGYSEHVRFNRKEAIIPLMGVYNFHRRTYTKMQKRGDRLKIDWNTLGAPSILYDYIHEQNAWLRPPLL